MSELGGADETQLLQAAPGRVAQSLQHHRVVLLQVPQQRPHQAPHVVLTARHARPVGRRVIADKEKVVATAAVDAPVGRAAAASASAAAHRAGLSTAVTRAAPPAALGAATAPA